MKKKMKDSIRVIGVSAGLIAIGFGAQACGQDASVGVRDHAPANVLNMPNGWSNVAHKCDGPNMVYATDHGDSYSSSLAVAANDPRCKDKVTP